MQDVVQIKEREDKDLSKLLQMTEKELQKKYSRKKMDSSYLEDYSTTRKVLSTILTVFTILVVVVTAILCGGAIYSLVKKTCPTFFGYSNLTVVSGSMTQESITINGKEYSSGFQIGDSVVVRSVDAKTLKVGDKIAFYVHSSSYSKFYSVSKKEITVDENTQAVAKTTLTQFFGFQPKQFTDATTNGGSLYFHHIIAIYEDENGTRWFKTQGSSNGGSDPWFTCEDMVVGLYDEGTFGRLVSGLLEKTSSNEGFFLFLLVSVLLIVANIAQSLFRELNLALLELDVVEDRRKLTEKVCVKNKIGYRMDQKAKYKVLCHAKPEEYELYISLLWKNDNSINSIRKYVLRKRRLIEYNSKLFDLHNQCQEMYRNNVPMNKITKFYVSNRVTIEKNQEKLEKRYRDLKQNVKKAKKIKNV